MLPVRGKGQNHSRLRNRFRCRTARQCNHTALPTAHFRIWIASR